VSERDTDRNRLQALVRGALARPSTERGRWIDEVSAGDVGLRDRLEDLVRIVEEETDPGAQVRPLDRGSDRPGGIGWRADVPEPRLTPGQQLGRYEILDLLGEGGMGTVYRALDPSLGREVAIKALAHAFRGDSGSLRRFEREARVLAALSHPNIASIYGFEQLDGSPYLVLERVDGGTLSSRLAAGPMPLREVLAVALQIVDGLEEAHAKGVIHRDLKPSNVMLAPGGRAKLVDFGLAKTSSRRAEPQTSAEPITEVGTVLGTARYMSPEQVQGDEVDTRTDVWAFGCVLYEMLAGRPTFGGRSVPDVLAAVLRDEPDWSTLPPETPSAIRRLLRRCLKRDPRARLQHIGDARLELMDAEVEPQPAAAAGRSRGWRLAQLAALPLLALAVAGGLYVLSSGPAGAARLPARLSLELPAQIALSADYAAPFAVAPTGTQLAIEGTEGGIRRLYIRGLADLALRPLLGTEGARQPFFSTDGAWVGFFADRKLAKVAVNGGTVLELADIGGNPRGATWAADGTIVVAPSQTSGLVRVSERGGRPSALTTLNKVGGEASHRWPDALPGARWVLFTVGLQDAGFDEGRIEAVSLDSGERRVVLAGAGFARYLRDGRLLFARAGRLHVVGFDRERVAVRGVPDVLLDGVRYDARNGGCHLAVSASGVVVYGPGVASSSDRYLVWVDRSGRVQRVMDTSRPFRDPRLSPDGSRIATVVGTSTESDLWLVDPNGTFSQVSFGLSPHRPAWRPDGSALTVGAEKSGTWRLLSIAADGGGSPATLVETSNRVYPNAWSPDGKLLVFQENHPETGWDLKVLETDGAGRAVGAPRPLAATPFHENNAALSPDGRWVAYESDEVDAVVQIYVRSFPDGGAKMRVSSEGARLPVWGRGGELFFWRTGEDGGLLVAHTRSAGGHLTVGAVEPIFVQGAASPASISRLVITVAGARFDVHPSATRLVALESVAAARENPYSRPVVVLDWAGRQP
jgi:serine/threonine-protein kinase